MAPLPKFDELVHVEGMPKGCAWGLWGPDDQLGTLNLLTSEVVLAAKNEIQKGISVAMNWEMTQNLRHPPSFRRYTKLEIIDALPSGTASFDDELYFNPQSGSQIDGLKHFAHQKTKKYYNGLTHEEILKDPQTPRNGIGNMSSRGGIVTRGVLLDFKGWAEEQNINFSPVSRFQISISQLEMVASYQNVELLPGDILIVRMGLVEWHERASEDEKLSIRTSQEEFIGVEGNEETARWIWDHQFSMVACDSTAFEAWPPEGTSMCLHEYMISMWGMPIGELWDLEKLAETCKQLKRWSFFFTSAPLNVAGGISSPPNALCIF
ncbi:MAG: hypothetical protein M1834_008440 [Cirrosporium novae-zelandiae]|nr:MAG: hypothetical protein M1834_008440 [Cirrosporium novae-zelandiae]